LVLPAQQRELFTGLIRIHVLVHASHEPIFGLAMMEELEHHAIALGLELYIRFSMGWSAAAC
jgi:hypothetical protein